MNGDYAGIKLRGGEKKNTLKKKILTLWCLIENKALREKLEEGNAFNGYFFLSFLSQLSKMN